MPNFQVKNMIRAISFCTTEPGLINESLEALERLKHKEVEMESVDSTTGMYHLMARWKAGSLKSLASFHFDKLHHIVGMTCVKTYPILEAYYNPKAGSKEYADPTRGYILISAAKHAYILPAAKRISDIDGVNEVDLILGMPGNMIAFLKASGNLGLKKLIADRICAVPGIVEYEDGLIYPRKGDYSTSAP